MNPSLFFLFPSSHGFNMFSCSNPSSTEIKIFYKEFNSFKKYLDRVKLLERHDPIPFQSFQILLTCLKKKAKCLAWILGSQKRSENLISIFERTFLRLACAKAPSSWFSRLCSSFMFSGPRSSPCKCLNFAKNRKCYMWWLYYLNLKYRIMSFQIVYD